MNKLKKAEFIIDIQEFKKLSIDVGYMNCRVNDYPNNGKMRREYERLKLKHENMHSKLIKEYTK